MQCIGMHLFCVTCLVSKKTGIVVQLYPHFDIMDARHIILRHRLGYSTHTTLLLIVPADSIYSWRYYIGLCVCLVSRIACLNRPSVCPGHDSAGLLSARIIKVYQTEKVYHYYISTRRDESKIPAVAREGWPFLRYGA